MLSASGAPTPWSAVSHAALDAIGSCAPTDCDDASAVFSLELYVQHVDYFLVPAPRHPAVAFRLLDFPTVLIYAPPQPPFGADSIFSAANFSAHTVYQFEKGKSCLFTLGRRSLQRLLQHVPMYLMLIDAAVDVTAESAMAAATAAETPPAARLLGSTAIDLSRFAGSQVEFSSPSSRHHSYLHVFHSHIFPSHVMNFSTFIFTSGCNSRARIGRRLRARLICAR